MRSQYHDPKALPSQSAIKSGQMCLLPSRRHVPARLYVGRRAVYADEQVDLGGTADVAFFWSGSAGPSKTTRAPGEEVRCSLIGVREHMECGSLMTMDLAYTGKSRSKPVCLKSFLIL